MNAAPKVPVINDTARSPALFLGVPFGFNAIIHPRRRMVGAMQRSITNDLSFHLSERYPTLRTQITPIALPGALGIRAPRVEYPKVVGRILLKLERPPVGMELRSLQLHTIQTLISLNVSNN